MIEIFDSDRLEKTYASLGSLFTARPPVMRMLQFEKGEFLNHPLKPLTQFLIVVEGSVSIYDLSDDGNIHYVSRAEKGTILGDVEFGGHTEHIFYTEADGHVLCLAIPFAENRTVIESDPVFLRAVIRQLTDKLTSSAMDIKLLTLEEKVLFYLKKMQPDHCIHSINETLLPLRCSRRQLQRVLKDLCDNGTIRKTGRGEYQLYP